MDLARGGGSRAKVGRDGAGWWGPHQPRIKDSCSRPRRMVEDDSPLPCWGLNAQTLYSLRPHTKTFISCKPVIIEQQLMEERHHRSPAPQHPRHDEDDNSTT